MSAYITYTYVGNALGTAKRNALIDSTTAVLSQLIRGASSLVEAALQNSGHDTVPTTGAAGDLVRRATFGALLPELYGRKGVDVPEQYLGAVDISARIISGELPLPNADPTAQNAVGGVKFSGSSESISGDKPQVYKNIRDEY